MRIRLLSDLHLEKLFYPPVLTSIPVDGVVLAGDIHQGTLGMEWARWQFPHTPIIYVAGNHEYYGSDFLTTLHELRTAAAEHGIFFLENDQVIVNGIRFLGTTLWTDFSLYGLDKRISSISKAECILPDYQCIKYGDSPFNAHISSTLFERAQCFLRSSIATPFEGKTVVVSHFAPSPRSIPSHYQGNTLSPAFASDLTKDMSNVDIWLHGHVHSPVDFFEGKCRVVANPAGYPDEAYIDYDPALVLDI